MSKYSTEASITMLAIIGLIVSFVTVGWLLVSGLLELMVWLIWVL